MLSRFPQINKHTCEYVYVNHNEINKGNHFACVQFHEGFLKKRKKQKTKACFSLTMNLNLMKFNEVKRL